MKSPVHLMPTANQGEMLFIRPVPSTENLATIINELFQPVGLKIARQDENGGVIEFSGIDTLSEGVNGGLYVLTSPDDIDPSEALTYGTEIQAIAGRTDPIHVPAGHDVYITGYGNVFLYGIRYFWWPEVA